MTPPDNGSTRDRTWPEDDARKLLLLEMRADRERREARSLRKRARKAKVRG